MRQLIKNSWILVILMLSQAAFAQKANVKKDSTKYIQMTGIVLTDSLTRVPFTKIVDLTTNRGVIADYYGYYALVVHPGDTIQFSCLGFKKKQYIVSDTTNLNSFSLVQIMKYDTLMANPTNVYPWPSREQFATAFVNMESPNDALKRARKRLTPQEMAFVGALMESDGSSSYNTYQQQFMQEQYSRGQQPANNLLNPASWSEFLKGFGTGKYRISN
ncbi:MAG: hypothetical protein ABJF27_15670 [Crocinitomicaceae bacterium]